MGIFPYLSEFEESLLYSHKLRVQQKMGTFPFFRNFSIFMGIFPFLQKFSHFYEKFPIFMGLLRKLALLSKATCSAKNGNFPIFMGIFPYLWEFEESLPYCRKLLFHQKMGTFPFLKELEESLHYYRMLRVLQKMGTFPFFQEFSHFYGNFTIFIGIFPFL